MNRYTRKDIDDALEDVGIKEGDTVFVSTSIYTCGKVKGVSLKEVASRLYSSLRKILTESGTIVVPSFHPWRYENGFSVTHSGTIYCGTFAEYIRFLPKSKRSWHPFYSVSAEGPRAEKIVDTNSKTGLGENSPFGVMEDVTILTLGRRLEDSEVRNFIHKKVGITSREIFKRKVDYTDFTGKTKEIEVDFYTNSGDKIPSIKEYLDSFKESKLGCGKVQSCDYEEFVDVASSVVQRQLT